MSWLDPRQWLLAIAFCMAGVLGYSFWSARLVAQGDATGYARAKSEYAETARKALESSRKRERDLQAEADAAEQEKNHALQNLDRVRADLLERLRKRPARPASGAVLPEVANAGGTASGCTGAQLYREDGEFLARESARAEAVRISLLACYAAYKRGQAVIGLEP